MSGICGIVNFDRSPVVEHELRRMVEAAPHRGIDGVALWLNEHVGFASLSVFITLESQRENQPLEVEDYILVADARVDNRADLMRDLDVIRDQPTDADLILAAYRRWGDDCAPHIIGDFAFALWDDREKRLFLARDPMAMRALYYRLEPDRLLFATEVKQILAVPGVPATIFEPALAAYLAGPNMPPEWTFYDGIEQLAAGHVLVGQNGRYWSRRFWDIDPEHRICYHDERDYAVHFRQLFKEAVSCRLRSIKPVGLLLSGGMDSVSIASTAGWLMQQDVEKAYSPFLAISHAFDEFPECDERDISSLVTDHFDFPSIHVPTDRAWPLSNYPAHGPDRDEPYIGVYQALIELDLALAQEQNVGLVMSGDRGDLLTAGWSFDYLGKLFAGEWGDLWSELREDSKFRQRSLLSVIRARLFWPLMARLWPSGRATWLREPVRKVLGRPEWEKKIYASWVRDDFARRTNLEETAREYSTPRSPLSEYGRKQRYELIFTSMHMRGVVWSERTQAKFGIGFADPWSDRRLAEYVLAIPHEVVGRPRQYKPLTRSAMQGIIPEPARKKVSKILPTPYYLRTLREKARPTVSDLIEHSLAHEWGFIDKAKLRAHYDEILAGSTDHPHFWWALTVEMWLRRFWS